MSHCIISSVVRINNKMVLRSVENQISRGKKIDILGIYHIFARKMLLLFLTCFCFSFFLQIKISPQQWGKDLATEGNPLQSRNFISVGSG